jgi:hypothetical protein
MHRELLIGHRVFAICLVREIAYVSPFGQWLAGISIATGSQRWNHQEPFAG